MSAGAPLIHARGLVKQFGELTAVDGVDFDLQRGEAFGFLGPNGAGKSSTMRMIGCVSPPSAGELSILGLDPVRDGREIRARLGVVPQEDTLDLELTVRENLLVYGRYFGLSRETIRERTAHLLDFVQLSDRAEDQVEPRSGGMKRRLTIARSLINEPEILLLDEPTTGLDPQARHVVWDRLFRLKQQGVTLVLTTHYMDEAEQLCDRLVVMDAGRIVAGGSPRELIERHSTREVVELRFGGTDSDDAAGKLEGIGERVGVLPDRILLYAAGGDAGGHLGPVRYLDYIVPGMLASTAMNVAFGESTWPVLSRFRWIRVYHSMVATPLRIADVVGGGLLYVLFRVLVTTVVFLGVTSVFGAVHSWWALTVPATCVLLGLAVALPIHAFSARVDLDSYFPLLMRFVVPLRLFSAVFFPIS